MNNLKTIILIKIALLLVSLNAFGQNGITFEVEKLSKPKKLIYQQHHNDIYQRLIQQNENVSEWDIEKYGIDFKYGIVAMSEMPDSLVNYNYNSFFSGMYQAYTDHRPFVLSPDMIWLLISQGFARHVNANAEELRQYFVKFSGKLTLVVESEEYLFTSPDKWEEIFPQFTEQISKHVGKDLVNVLTSDFSTTTPVEKIASQITIMEAMESYFEYAVMTVGCGIPEITLLGTTKDWQNVLEKTKKLSRYELKWWTDELVPLLEQFVEASKGEVDKKFWQNMFKYHSQKKYGAPNIIDGWFVKFFPYDEDGKRNDLKKLVGGDHLPDEIVNVDVKYIITDGIFSEEIMMELWSGFIGLEQDPVSYALTPKIGWMVRTKDVEKDALFQSLNEKNIPNSSPLGSGIEMRISEVPEVLNKLDVIYSLKLEFVKDVVIPDWLKDKRIGRFTIKGNLKQSEIDKIVQWFPNTDLKINGKEYNVGKGRCIFVYGGTIPQDVLMMEKIWVLEISNYKGEYSNLEELKNIDIEILSFAHKTSPETIEKLKTLLPKTKIFVEGNIVE